MKTEAQLAEIRETLQKNQDQRVSGVFKENYDQSINPQEIVKNMFSETTAAIVEGVSAYIQEPDRYPAVNINSMAEELAVNFIISRKYPNPPRKSGKFSTSEEDAENLRTIVRHDEKIQIDLIKKALLTPMKNLLSSIQGQIAIEKGKHEGKSDTLDYDMAMHDVKVYAQFETLQNTAAIPIPTGLALTKKRKAEVQEKVQDIKLASSLISGLEVAATVLESIEPIGKPQFLEKPVAKVEAEPESKSEKEAKPGLFDRMKRVLRRKSVHREEAQADEKENRSSSLDSQESKTMDSADLSSSRSRSGAMTASGSEVSTSRSGSESQGSSQSLKGFLDGGNPPPALKRAESLKGNQHEKEQVKPKPEIPVKEGSVKELTKHWQTRVNAEKNTPTTPGRAGGN